jgi:anaerobic magnesium-protoporphyrin IX monomethyl ester cyclase
MKALLVFPPFRDPTRPHPALPLHAAVVAASGAGSARIEDANIAFWDESLRRGGLLCAMEAIRSRLDRCPAGDPGAMASELRAALALGERVADKVEGARGALQSQSQFQDAERYTAALKVLRLGLRVLSARWWPTRMDLVDLKLRFSPESKRDVEQAVDAADENPFIEFFDRTTARRVREEGFALVKISLIYPSQVIPGLTLARRVKQAAPQVHVALGGTWVCQVADRLRAWPWLFEQADSLITDAPIPYDSEYGEDGLVALMASLNGRRALRSVPGLVYRDPNSSAIAANPRGPPVDPARLPAPTFDDVRWGSYLSPAPVVSLSFTRGCRWDRCSFCGHRGEYRSRSAAQALEDVRALKRRGYRCFHFCDDSADADLVRGLAAGLLAARVDCRWHWMIRPGHGITGADCKALFDAGCRSVFVGLESASPRVLRLIDNGASPEAAIDLVRSSDEAGIGARSFSIVGFPTESEAEAAQTLELLRGIQGHLRLSAVLPFLLTPGSRMQGEPDAYGIAEVSEPSEDDLRPHLAFAARGGMSRASALELASRCQQTLLSEAVRPPEPSAYFSPLLSAHGLLRLASDSR